MIEFLTLFLNLVGGPQHVELAVGPQVAVVEVRVDRQPQLVLDGPPWAFTIDLGASLAPHVIEAVARDAAGRELARAEQGINLPREPVELRLIVERDAGGQPVAVRVAWETSTEVYPSAVRVRCGTRQLQGDVRGRYLLPHLDLGAPHIISAELEFPRNVTVVAQTSVGGGYGGEVRSALTAVPVHAVSSAEPAPADVVVHHRSDHRELPVVALEKLGSRLFVVTDPHAYSRLQRFARMLDTRGLRGFPGSLIVDGMERHLDEDLVILVHPCADEQSVRGEPRWIFPEIGPLSLASRSLPWVLCHARLEQLPRRPRRVADAVASAGVSAASTAAPRAVLLLTTGEDDDGSQYGPDGVRRYLAALRVPFQAWDVDGGESAWTDAVDVSSVKELRAAAARLRERLDGQWIAWVEGRHYPQEIEITRRDSGPPGSPAPPTPTAGAGARPGAGSPG